MTLQHKFTLNNDQLDTSGNGRRVLRIYDDAGQGVSVAQARQYVNDNGLGFGSEYPGTTLRATSPVFDQNGAVVDVSLTFLPSGQQFPNPPLDPLDPAFQSMDATYQIERVQLPSFETAELVTKNDAGDVTDTKIVWQRAPDIPPIEKDVHTFIYRLNGTFAEQLSVAGWLSLSAQIRAQANRLHLFGGVYYLFRPRTLSQESSSDGENPPRYRIEYEWTFDPGLEHRNDFTASAGGQPLLRGDGTRFYPVADDTFFIPPWQNVWTAPGAGGPEDDPVVIFRDRYERDDNGWQSLPGIGG